MRTEDGAALTANLATRHARSAVASLLEAIDAAEADKIATRGDPTQTTKRPKRNGKRGITKKRAIRPPTRAKRIEDAAFHLHSVFADLLGEEGAPLELISSDDVSAGLILAALTELNQALGKKRAPKIAQTNKEGFSR